MRVAQIQFVRLPILCHSVLRLLQVLAGIREQNCVKFGLLKARTFLWTAVQNKSASLGCVDGGLLLI